MKWLLALFAALPLTAHGITITFDNPDSYFVERGNFVVGGLRFSPWCHQSAHVGHAELSPSGTYMSSDQDNDNCRRLNDNYLGPQEAWGPDFYVDHFGLPFTLRGLACLGYEGRADCTVASSKGGGFEGQVFDDDPVGYGAFTFSGEEWTDITWFKLRNFGDTLPFHKGWDDIRYTVPEPPTWALVMVPAAFGIAFRKRFPRFFNKGQS
jgi:hypothetical protein